jgi:hypothetical protein
MKHKIKTYKNPQRGVDNSVKPYVPQYKSLNIKPTEIASNEFPPNTVLIKTNQEESPRNRKIAIQQPYGVPPTESIGNSKLPNVGNNVEQTWSYIDNEMVDDLTGEVIGKLDDNTPMIDNNNQSTQSQLDQQEPSNADDSNFSMIKDNDYILLINGIMVTHNSKETIEQITSDLVFGKHEICNGIPIPVEDITILKKIKINIGLFL